jgi:acyl-coenzyme A synthetase/AMP-(fatty) acid ligase
MQSRAPNSLREALIDTSSGSDRFLWSAESEISFNNLLRGSILGGRISEFSGHSVLIVTHDQLATALSLVELDGVARRVVICPSDLSEHYLPSLVAEASVDAIVSDCARLDQKCFSGCAHVVCGSNILPAKEVQLDHYPTEWVLLTSGTTGSPKMLVHSLASLAGAIKSGEIRESPIIWGTFYDIRRYGGLQIFLRCVLGGASFVLPSVDEPLGNYLVRLGEHAATHILGTPSHWRRVLMSPAARAIAPSYIRLSGEIADQTILNRLRSFYPQAGITHAFASTEAGVGFEVNDGLEGFSAKLVGGCGEVELKVDEGSLRIRSARVAQRYIGEKISALADDEGFVDTGDIVELRGDRYYFLGRRGGIINVGGLKVHPEEVETVINRHPQVRMSRVRSRKNPITGSIVVADIVLKSQLDCNGTPTQIAELEHEILQSCRELLARHKIPATIHFVPDLDLSASGKVARHA